MFSRKFAAIAISAGLLLTTAGCSFNPNPDSLQSYAPSDGSGADVELGKGEVIKLRNFLYLTDGTEGSLLGSIANSGKKVQTVTINYVGADGQAQQEVVDVPGESAVGFGYEGALKSVIKIDGKPGALAKVTFGLNNNSQWVDLNIPVLDDTHAYYKDAVEGLAVVPTAEPTATETPEAEVTE